MADRTSARIFGSILELLSEDPNEDHKELARNIMRLGREYDFSPEMMHADEACLKLGIIRLGIHPRYPNEWIMRLYFGEPGFDDAEELESLDKVPE